MVPEGESSRIVASLKALRDTAGGVYTSSQDELNPAEDTLSPKDQSARNDRERWLMDRNHPGRGCIRIGGKKTYESTSPSKDADAYFIFSTQDLDRSLVGRCNLSLPSTTHLYFLLYYQSSVLSVVLTGDTETAWLLY